VENRACARMAYEGLMEYVHHFQTVPLNARHLQHVHFVSVDRDTTETMADVMRIFYEKKHMFKSELADQSQNTRPKNHSGWRSRLESRLTHPFMTRPGSKFSSWAAPP